MVATNAPIPHGYEIKDGTLVKRSNEMSTVRAKFSVQQVLQSNLPDGTVYSENVTLSPVWSPDPESENRAFWKATPSGRIDMYINNPDAFGEFKQGQEYYVDFTPAKS